MNQYLALTVLCPNKPDILVRLTQFFAASHCQILSSRMLAFGSQFTMLMLIAGPWNEIAKIETHLPEFAANNELTINYNRAELVQHEMQKWIPYTVELIAHESTGIIETICSFFADMDIIVYELHNNPYTANPLGIPMYALGLRILVPSDTQLSDLRERFITVCDFLNVDAYLEPERA